MWKNLSIDEIDKALSLSESFKLVLRNEEYNSPIYIKVLLQKIKAYQEKYGTIMKLVIASHYHLYRKAYDIIVYSCGIGVRGSRVISYFVNTLSVLNLSGNDMGKKVFFRSSIVFKLLYL